MTKSPERNMTTPDADVRECFWPKCSNHKRCDAFGSCVALAQRKAIANGDFPSASPAPAADAVEQVTRDKAIQIIRDVLSAYAIDADSLGPDARREKRQRYAEHAVDTILSLPALSRAPVGAKPFDYEQAKQAAVKIFEYADANLQNFEESDAAQFSSKAKALYDAARQLHQCFSDDATPPSHDKARRAEADILRAYKEFYADPDPTSYEAFKRAIRSLAQKEDGR